LQFERLECRAVLNGSVEIINHGAFIVGDGAANNIVIHQIGKATNNAVTVQIQGIGTKLLVAKPSNTTGSPTEFFPPTNIVTITGVYTMDISLGGGNDSLYFYNTTVPGTFSIDMGTGNDTLVMNNVHDLFPGFNPPPGILVATEPSFTPIQLGSGNDVAILTNVSASGDLSISAGDGRDTVALSHVAAGKVKTQFAHSNFGVDMGPGNSDLLTIVNCTGDAAFFGDNGGTNGTLLKSGNQFTSETESGFAHTMSM
jgi:hypothetical protein